MLVVGTAVLVVGATVLVVGSASSRRHGTSGRSRCCVGSMTSFTRESGGCACGNCLSPSNGHSCCTGGKNSSTSSMCCSRACRVSSSTNRTRDCPNAC